MSDAFISYRRKPSTALAHLIQKELQGRYRLDVYLDTTRTDSANVQFPDRLLGAIDSSQVFVCLLASTTLESEWVRKEIDRAYQQKKPCIPVFQEGFTPNSSDDPALSYLLGFDAVHVLEYQGLFVDESLEKIARIIKQTVAPSRRRRWLRVGVASVGLIATVALGIFLTANQIRDLPPVSTATQNTVESTITAQDIVSAPTASDTTTLTATSTPSASSTATVDVGATQVTELQLSLTALAIQQFEGEQTATAGSLTRSANILQETLFAVAETGTADALAITQSVIDGTATQESNYATRTRDAELFISGMTGTARAWTSTPTSTRLPPTPTLTPTATNTRRPTATSQATQVASESSEARAVVSVASANLRSGPGINYSIVGSAPQNEQFRIIARISDNSWYLIEQANGELAWISSGIVDVNVGNSQIEVVATVPATPRTIASSQPDTAQSIAPCIPPMINNGQRGIYQDGAVFTGDPNNYGAARIGQITSGDVFMRISSQYICTQNVGSNGYTSYAGWIYVRIIEVVSGSNITVGSVGWIPITLTDDSGYQLYQYTFQ